MQTTAPVVTSLPCGHSHDERRRITRPLVLGPLALLLVLPCPSFAQNADELAKQTQNPVASLISVPLQGNWDFGLGDRDATGTLLNIQPVMPFAISKGANVILRVIMPLASQPGSSDTRVNGLGDIIATAFFSPSNAGRVIWGAGPVFQLPAATNNTLGGESSALARRLSHSFNRGNGRSARYSIRFGRRAEPTIAAT